MSTVISLTTYDLDRHLAAKQLRHYLYIKQAAAGIGDKTEYRRATDIIDKLMTEYGAETLRQAENEYRV
jgi:hypothetical protein